MDGERYEMKKITIIPVDNIVVIDGEALVVEVTADPDIHAIQWDEEKQKGHIEYVSSKDKLEIESNGFAKFLPFVEKFNQMKVDIAFEIANPPVSEFDRRYPPELYSTKRMIAFDKELKVRDQMDEILRFIDSQPVKSIKMQAIIDKSNDIKRRFPKEGE